MRTGSSSLYLISGKAVKKKYDMLHIILSDESVFEFKLNEYNVTMIDHDWVEISNVDETVMEWFAMQNIMRMKFVSSRAKLVTGEKPPLLPVA